MLTLPFCDEERPNVLSIHGQNALRDQSRSSSLLSRFSRVRRIGLRSGSESFLDRSANRVISLLAYAAPSSAPASPSPERGYMQLSVAG